jgi:peptide/nickel transport system permease protein
MKVPTEPDEREEMLRKRSREITMGRLKGFLNEYRQNRLGILGLCIMLFFIVLGIVGPLIDKSHPLNDMDLADGVVPPDWIVLLGGEYAKLPPTIIFEFPKRNEGHLEMVYNTTEQLTATLDQTGLHIALNKSHSEGDSAVLTFIGTLDYKYKAPRQFKVIVKGLQNATGYLVRLKIFFQQPSGRCVVAYDSRALLPQFSATLRRGGQITISSLDFYYVDWFSESLGLIPDPYIVSSTLFNETGVYKIVFRFEFSGINQIRLQNSDLNFTLSELSMKVFGLRYGILGTDAQGRSIFAQLVNGIWISLSVGVISSLLSSIVSSILGIIAVIEGGVVDEFLMRLADIMMILPGTPLLLIIMPVVKGDIWTAIILIGIIFAPSGARGARAFVLTYINSPYIEVAKARGASKLRLITRHVLPPMLPLIYANMASAAPAAITMEAELSYLGIATDPFRMTWGKMLQQSGVGMSRWAWWWVMPPGVCIMLLSLAFVLIGHALDEIMNPRLKKRR